MSIVKYQIDVAVCQNKKRRHVCINENVSMTKVRFKHIRTLTNEIDYSRKKKE